MTEIDTELRDLVSQTLQANGILPKIRAELRAGVFLALESSPAGPDIIKNSALVSCAHTPAGAIALNLIRQMLGALDLQFSLSVFEPETHFGKHYTDVPCEDLAERLGLSSNSEQPLLLTIVQNLMESKNNVQNTTPNLNATYIKAANESPTIKTPEATPKKGDTSDLLIFTPVQTKNRQEMDEKPDVSKKMDSKMSSLADLPPLNAKGNKSTNIGKIRGFLEASDPEISTSSQSEDLSTENKSNEIEEEISEVLSNQKSSISNGTVDITVSHVTDKSLDHLESL